MSAVAGNFKSTPIYSGSVSAGKRSFFFDVKRAPKGELYFMISELTGRGDVWTKSRVLVPAEQAREFYMGLCDAIKAMREAAKDEPEPAPQKAPPARKTKPQPAAKQRSAQPAKAPVRAVGRASQGANRAALV